MHEVPPPFEALGRWLLLAGVFLALAGLGFLFLGKLPGLGRLPGDIVVQRGRFTFVFPLMTCLLLSLLLTLILNLFFRR